MGRVDDQAAAFDPRRDPWPTYPAASTEAWPTILLAPPTTQPINWSGWFGVPRV